MVRFQPVQWKKMKWGEMRAIEGRGAIFCFLEGGSVLYGGQVSANPERSKGVSTEHVQGERIRGRDHRQAEALRLGWF